MKTTLELPDDLLMEAKAVAARRRTTLRAIFERALRREIRPSSEAESPDPQRYETGPFGILRIKRLPGELPTTDPLKRTIEDDLDNEDLQRALKPAPR